MITKPRLNPPTVDAVADRLSKADISCEQYPGEGLLAFFHEDTLSEIYGWRLYFREREEDGTFDRVDDWIKMVACSRLTGHSPGFFSVKTLPPNFAVTVDAQRKLNEKSGQVPEYRDTRALILRKTESLLRDKLPVGYDGTGVPIYDYSADRTPAVESGSVDLVVTSPPFLDVVNYHADNWMRMWFYDVDIPKSRLWEIKNATRWSAKMTMVFKELYRVLRPGGMIAFEVGEIKDGTLSLDPARREHGFPIEPSPAGLVHQHAPVQQDLERLGRQEQRARHEHESGRRACQTLRRLLMSKQSQYDHIVCFVCKPHTAFI